MNNLSKMKLAFFFADVEHSTELIQKLGEGYAGLLELYRAVIRTALEENAGEEVDTAGDGFFAVFRRPEQAVSAAVAAQRVFYLQEWARQSGFRVRIGIHFGEAILMARSCVGLEVHRASRICGAGHGGQTLLSQVAFEEIQDNFPHEVTTKDLGTFLLRGFEHPEQLHQLVIPGLPSDFPALRTEPGLPTVAVIPFANLSGDPAQDYFCDGMADEIIIALGKIPGLRVVSRSSSFALKGQGLNSREMGRRLGSQAILEGAVKKTDNRVRVTTELVDVKTGFNLWSGAFDTKIQGLFSVQDEIAENIAMALKVKLFSGQIRGIQEIQTSDVQAYDFYLQGRQFFYQFTPRGTIAALEMFKKAIELDDAYALAYCGMANCYSYLYMYVDNSEENIQKAEEAGHRAIELDPALAEAHAAHGLALSQEKLFEEAEASFKRAIELDPDLFEAYFFYARVSFVNGQLQKAATLYETANRKRPEDYQSLLLAGQMYADLGRHERAAEARRRGIEIAERVLRVNPGDTRALYLGANGLVALGEKEKGLDWVRRALTLQPDDPMALYNVGCVYALLDMTEEAVTCLENAFEAGITQRGWYENDSNLDSLRDHPRFKALLERL